jgi:hypothetical protein
MSSELRIPRFARNGAKSRGPVHPPGRCETRYERRMSRAYKTLMRYELEKLPNEPNPTIEHQPNDPQPIDTIPESASGNRPGGAAHSGAPPAVPGLGVQFFESRP